MTTPRPLDSLSGRTVLLSVVIALVAAVVTVAVSIPLINGAARAQAQATLDRLADVTVAALQRPSATGSADRLRDLLSSQQISAYLIGPGLPAAPGLSPTEQRQVLSGGSVDVESTISGTDYLVAARPLTGSYGVVLLAPTDNVVEPASSALRRLLAAVVAGLVVASLIGYLVSRRLTRPLRQFADTARALSTGRRGLQVTASGPREITDIAQSLNGLSQALDVSEGRQRDFLLSVSHELRTPLTAVHGYAEALSDGMIAPADVPGTARVMSAETERMERLVADLLDLARLGAVDFEIRPLDVDLVELAREAAVVWRDRCEREGVTFSAEIPAGPVFLRTDPVRMRQIIDNLAENALRVTPQGHPIVLAVEPQGRWVATTVRDGGPGLTDDDLSVAFEPAALYSRYRGVRTVGSGVGLALVGRLAQRLGGTARAGRAPEGGAAFTVLLPRVLPTEGGFPDDPVRG
ncbi:MAG: HAMP domain-containing sensor histidine kinase [Candidatus Nanopelagicales bacterium]